VSTLVDGRPGPQPLGTEPRPRPAPEPAPRRGRPPARNEILRGGLLAGIAPERLAAAFGTPLYVYDLDVVNRQVAALRAALPARFDLAYAVKANPALAVVEHTLGLGLGADVASGGELEAALRARAPRELIVFTGPGKRDQELERAVRLGIRAITVESPAELDRLERLAAAAGRRVPILLRQALSEAARLERVRLVGDDGAGKFGMGLADLYAAAARAARSAHLEPLGIHAFGASNVLAAVAVARHVRDTVETAKAVAAEAGFPLRLVDVGGGLGIPYEAHEDSLDLVGLSRRLAELEEGWRSDPSLSGMRILLEPGRFLVGPAGAYLARVVDVKGLEGTCVAILDGGIHHFLRPALVGQEHRLRLLREGDERGAKLWPVTIAGPLCSGLDVFSQHAVMTEPCAGDLVAVLDAGAYGLTESPLLFLSHGVPAEVAVKGGRAELIRPRLEPGELLRLQRQPLW
jgi:diaminopimelate decarboxylase